MSAKNDTKKDIKETKEAADNKPAEKTTPTTGNKKAAKTSRSATVALLITLLIVAAVSYLGWTQYQQQQTELLNKLNELYMQNNTLQQAHINSEASQQQQLDELREQQKELLTNFSNLLKNSEHLRKDWLLAEAEYLIKIASHRLLLEKDINTAITALQGADDRLKQIADPALLEVRKVLVEQIQSLKNVAQADIAGLSLQISSLEKQVPQLSSKTPDPATVAKRDKQPSHASQVESWSDLPAAMWQDIKGLVVIRDHSQAIQPLIPPEQHYFLKQNLALKLEQARFALLKGNQPVFADSLTAASNWLQTYFDTEQQSTKSMLESIETMLQTNIDPEIPDISQSYKALEKYRHATPVPGEKPAEQAKPGNSDKS